MTTQLLLTLLAMVPFWAIPLLLAVPVKAVPVERNPFR